MEHLAGKHETKDLRLGDTVTDSNGIAIDAVCLNFGYATPSNLDQGLRVVKVDLIMGGTKEIFLSKEEVFELYAYFKNKGLFAHLDT